MLRSFIYLSGSARGHVATRAFCIVASATTVGHMIT